MTEPREQRYRRLLRWYPRSWRDRHGEVLLGILLDDAEAHDRHAPNAREHAVASLHGIASRLTTPVALGSALAGLALAALGGIAQVWAPALVVSGYLHWISSVLALLALVCLARERALLSDGRSLAVLALAAPAFLLGALALRGWGEAFDAADADVAATGLGAAWAILLVVSWVLGSAVCILLLDALFVCTSLPRAAVATVSLALGVLLATSIAPLLLTPLVPALVSAAAAGLALGMPRPGVADSRASAAALPPAAPAEPAGSPNHRPRPLVSPSMRRGARALAAASGLSAMVGIAYSFTGTQWSPAAPDATIAMGQGISIALLSAVPLLAAVGMLAAARSRHALHSTWGPLGLVALSLAAVAVAYLAGPEWGALLPGFATGAVLTGTALAWWMTARQRGPRHLRIVLSALTGLAYASIFGMFVAPMLAFVVPIGALLLTLWPTRRRARIHPSASPAGTLDAVPAHTP